MVGADFPEGIHHIRIAVQTEDLFLCSADGEFGLVLNASGIGKVQCTEAGLCQIHADDIPFFCQSRFPHLDAVLEIGGRQDLV